MTDWREKRPDTPDRRASHAAEKMAAWRAFCAANPEPSGRSVWPYTLDNPSPASRRIAEQLERARHPVAAEAEEMAE